MKIFLKIEMPQLRLTRLSWGNFSSNLFTVSQNSILNWISAVVSKWAKRVPTDGTLLSQFSGKVLLLLEACTEKCKQFFRKLFACKNRFYIKIFTLTLQCQATIVKKLRLSEEIFMKFWSRCKLSSVNSYLAQRISSV